MRLPKYVAFGHRAAGDLGINPFALTLIAESFADDPQKYNGDALVSAQAHNGTDVFILLTKTQPVPGDFDRDGAPAPGAAAELLAACKFVKSFLTKLEDGTTPGDPLREIRRKFHAPVHAVLDAAISKAEE